MIPKDDEFRFAASALQLVHMNAVDIEDSEQGHLRFRDPSPNWLTAREVGKTLEFMENGLIELGASRVEPHGPYGMYFAWPADPESRLEELARILLLVRDAIESAKPRVPRSAIRECLLEAEILLERLLVEETAKETIKRRVPEFDMSYLQ